jgi:hypothetical protein
VRVASVVFALALAHALVLACSKKEEPSASKEDRSGHAVARASAEGELAAQAKGALVVQQGNLACGARPGIDSAACTRACAAACASETDVPRIDACASKVASESPAL